MSEALEIWGWLIRACWLSIAALVGYAAGRSHEARIHRRLRRATLDAEFYRAAQREKRGER